MIARCRNKRREDYRYYGGRGISVCEQWRKSFTNFFEDMGRRPTAEHSLDRYPNQDGNYEPGNCRWATKVEQANNTSTNRLVLLGGLKMTFADALRGRDISRGAVEDRILRGWSVEDAFNVQAGGVPGPSDSSFDVLL